MANFFVPRGADKSRYAMTSDGGFDHPWKLTVNVTETLRVGLWGGYDNDQSPLKLSSNNPGIVTVSEPSPSFPADRILAVRGRKPGFTILDANGAYGPWCSMQIEVRQGKPAPPSGSAAQGPDDEMDFEVDPDTGELVHLINPKAHKLYVDRVFTDVAYGILPDGYYVYCEGMELPINVPENMVDFSLATAEYEMSQIYDTFNEAKSAANDSAGKRRVAYFWGAGGAVISPTTIGPATTPQLYSTIIAVRDLRDVFVSVMLPAITMAIGMVSGPSPMAVKNSKGTGRIAKKRGGTVPPRANPSNKPAAPTATKIKPLNGQVSVGGGYENKVGSNLNPTKPGSGGPTKGIPNHVPGSMEDMAELFEPRSVQKMISSRLRYHDVDWSKGTKAAARVMAPNGKVAMNVWTQSPVEQEALKAAFKSSGFKNVRVVQVGMDGSSTMVFADF